jgi:two-component system response regulator LytT
LKKNWIRGFFFRVNRKYLVNIHNVKRIKALIKGKLSLDLNPAAGEEIVISQERASAFKTWMGN